MGRKPRCFAISATNLQGVFLDRADPKILSLFGGREPMAKIGYSIFIFKPALGLLTSNRQTKEI